MSEPNPSTGPSSGPSPEDPQRPSGGDAPPGRPPVDPTGAAAPPPPPPGYAPQPAAAGDTPRRGTILPKAIGSSVLGLLVFSIILNVYLGVLIYRMSVGPSEVVYQRGESDERIVILPLEGLIRESTYTFTRQALRQLRDDPPAAIVLRVESPGGAVGASDRTLAEIKRFRQRLGAEGHDIPVIASFGSFATSGGYYVAMATDEIVAEPTGTTGSIGVIAQAFTLPELMDKIGVTPEIITSAGSTRKDLLNTFRPWDEEDRDVLRTILDNNYEQFVTVVHEGRGDRLSIDEVRELATGEVFTAEAAAGNGLIDSVGYLADAIDLAAAAADIDVEPHVTLMRPATGGLLGLISGRSPAPAARPAAFAEGFNLENLSPREVRDWLSEASMPRTMYLAPVYE